MHDSLMDPQEVQDANGHLPVAGKLPPTKGEYTDGPITIDGDKQEDSPEETNDDEISLEEDSDQ